MGTCTGCIYFIDRKDMTLAKQYRYLCKKTGVIRWNCVHMNIHNCLDYNSKFEAITSKKELYNTLLEEFTI